MMLDNKKTVKLSELIHWVKKELLSDNALKNDPVPLFIIDEVTVEINFTLSGEGEAGFDLVVVKSGAKVAEERVQKAIVRMKPLIPFERVREKLSKEQLEQFENEGVKVFLKGHSLSEALVPPRE